MYRYVGGKADWLAMGWPREGGEKNAPYLGQLSRADVPTCRPHELVGEVRRRVAESGWDRCVVIDDGSIVIGLLDPERLSANGALTAELAMQLGPSTYRPSVPAAEMAEHMRSSHRWHALVTNSDGVLIGVIDRARVEGAVESSKRSFEEVQPWASE